MGKILIADASEEFRSLLAAALEPEHSVITCADGIVALELLAAEAPDLMVLDLMLRGDGMAVLQSASDRGSCPRTVIIGSFFSDYILHLLSEYPVEYVLRRPCSIQTAAGRIADLLGRRESPVLQLQSDHAAVTTMLHQLGIPTNYTGFDQLRQGILMLAKQPGLPVTKVVYPTIAASAIQGGTAGTVERNIRSAITAAYERRDDRIWRRYFLPAANGQIPKPTNTRFMTRLAEELASGTSRKAK